MKVQDVKLPEWDLEAIYKNPADWEKAFEEIKPLT